jgi:hypothetical protein
MKNLLKTFVALLTPAIITLSAHALPITGGISLAGGYTTDTGNLNTADAFTAFNNVIVTSRAGSYAPVALGQAVTQNAFSFAPFPAGGVTPLWTFTVGGTTTYNFNLLSLQPIEQPGDNTLTLRGSGILSITGWDNTEGSWLFTGNQGGGTFSFSSSNAPYGPENPGPGAGVPDGGSSVVLLASGLVGLVALRRKLLS